jgi:hypothetical protein
LEIRRLGKEITEQVADIEKDTQESEQATTLRKKENKDFLVTQKDFSESIDALQRALKVLKTSDEKVSLSLVQLLAVRSLKNLPEDAIGASTRSSRSSSDSSRPPPCWTKPATPRLLSLTPTNSSLAAWWRCSRACWTSSRTSAWA